MKTKWSPGAWHVFKHGATKRTLKGQKRKRLVKIILELREEIKHMDQLLGTDASAPDHLLHLPTCAAGVEAQLRSTTEPEAWAAAFLEWHDGQKDEGVTLLLMTSWFQNAIETGRLAGRVHAAAPDEDRMVGQLAAKLMKIGVKKVRLHGSEVVACCPLHDDKKASMHAAVIENRPAFYCMAGCDPAALLEKIEEMGRNADKRRTSVSEADPVR